MRYHKGKWKASYKDTWDMEHCLRPIIGAGVSKFLEVLKTKDCASVPVTMLELVGVEDYNDVTPEQHQQAHDLWIGILEKMSFAFNSSEPDIHDYKFDIDFVNGRSSISNKEEHERYTKDTREYYDKRYEGYRLFGEYLNNLWS